MSRKEKVQGEKSGKKKIWIIIVFLVIALIVAGVVIGVTYWPASIKGVVSELQKNALVEYRDYEGSENFKVENSSIYLLNSYIYDQTYGASKNLTGDNKNEVDSVFNVIYSLDVTNKFYQQAISSFDITLPRKDIKTLSGNISKARQCFDKINEVLDNHESTLLSYTVILSVWDEIRIQYRDLLTAYENYYDKLTDVLSSHDLSGVYGNDRLVLFTDGMHAYVKEIKDLFFSSEKDSAKALKLSEYLYKNYTSADISGAMTSGLGAASDAYSYKSIREYYIDSQTRKDTADIKLLSEKTEKKVNFEVLIENLFNIDSFSLTGEQMTYVNLAKNLLLGGQEL